ncbi:MAG: MOSC domain-containing protein [Pseudomonadota bacterium]
MDAVELIAQDGIAGDRQYAIARAPGSFDIDEPRAVPKSKFIVLLRDAAIAALKTSYDPPSETLTVVKPAGDIFRAQLATKDGRAALETFIKAYLDDQKLEPRVVSAAGHKFTDISVVSQSRMRAVSLVNLASIRALEAAIGKAIHPLRFRANIYIDGLPAWQEFDWVGKDIQIGAAQASVVMRTKRCGATDVDPETAQRDLSVPALIKRHFGHYDMGVYAEISASGMAAIGDPVLPS